MMDTQRAADLSSDLKEQTVYYLEQWGKLKRVKHGVRGYPSTSNDMEASGGICIAQVEDSILLKIDKVIASLRLSDPVSYIYAEIWLNHGYVVSTAHEYNSFYTRARAAAAKNTIISITQSSLYGG